MEKTVDFKNQDKAELQVHRYIGEQLRKHRMQAGLSQEDLGNELQVTFQQYQKYEQGKNRISPGNLYILAHVLQVPIASLFPQIKVKDYEPTAPRLLQIMKRISRVVNLHPDEMAAISKALLKICGDDGAAEG